MIDWDALVLAPLQATFGEPVTFIPASGDKPIVGPGVFMEAYQQLEIAGGQSVTTESPMIGISVSDFQTPYQALPKQGDKFVRQKTGIAYTVREVELDGVAGAKVLLNEAPYQ